MIERTATIASRVGLHARPAAIFAEAAAEIDIDITIAGESDPADLTSKVYDGAFTQKVRISSPSLSRAVRTYLDPSAN